MPAASTRSRSGPRGLRRPVEEPLGSDDPPAADRAGPRVPARGTARRMLAGEPINTTEGRAVLHTALRAPGARACSATKVHEVLDRLLAFRRATRHRSQRHHRRRSTSASAARISARRWWCRRWMPSCTGPCASISSAMSMATTSRRCCVAWRPSARCSSSPAKTFTTQETMANAAVAREWFLAQGGTDIARHFVGAHHQPQGRGGLRHPPTFGFWGLGGGRYSLWSRSACRSPSPSVPRLPSLLGRACDGPALRARAAAGQPAGATGLLDVWYRNFHGFTSRSVAPYHQGLQAPSGLSSTAEMEKQRQGVDLGGQPLPCHQPGGLGRARHQWPACLLPDAAPGRRRDPGGVHRGAPAHPRPCRPACQGAGQCLAQSQARLMLLQRPPGPRWPRRRPPPPTSWAVRQLTVAPPHLPGQRPSTTLVLEQLTPRALGRIDRAVRAPGVHQRRAVGPQQLRPVGWSWARRWPATCCRAWPRRRQRARWLDHQGCCGALRPAADPGRRQMSMHFVSISVACCSIGSPRGWCARCCPKW